MATLAATLDGLAAMTASTAPAMGSINVYNASAGVLAPTLPVLALLNVGASCFVQKDTLDASANAVTFTRSGSDTFQDATTSFVLNRPGQYAQLTVISVGGTKYWKIIGQGMPKIPGGLTAITSQMNLNTSVAEANVVAFTLPASELVVGTTYRIKMLGTVQVQATSGTLTFRPYLGVNVSTETYQMPSQGGAAGPVPFCLEVDITVRTTGAVGTYISNGWGRMEFATPVILTTATATTATIDTTAVAPVLKLTAQWATSSATNILKVETATIERVI